MSIGRLSFESEHNVGYIVSVHSEEWILKC